MHLTSPRRAVAALGIVAAAALGVSTTAVATPISTTPAPPAAAAIASGAITDAAASVGQSAPPATAADKCAYYYCYDYVYGRQRVQSDGASATYDLAKPEIDPTDSVSHSLAEMAVQSADGNQIVEIGWTVDRSVNGDVHPHLFSFFWSDYEPTCYNTCGFVSTSDTIKPGMKLPSGGRVDLAIHHVEDRWELSMNGTVFGYYPDSLWQGRYTRMGYLQVFGEVSGLKTPTCTDMGSGKRPTSAAATRISNVRLLGTEVATNLTVKATEPSLYDVANVSADAFSFGGPGTGSCHKQ